MMSGDCNRTNERAEALEAAEEGRREWVSPAVTRMRAGDAEMPGDNPIIPEGFAMGS